MNVSIFGLGYVGIVNLVCLSKLGHTVYGCDIKSQKVDGVLAGQSPVYEPGVNELLEAGLKEGRVKATIDANEVVKNSDLALICVGTPSREDGTVNLDYTINTTINIAKAILAYDKEKYTIVYRSTIPPGTIETSLVPILKEKLGDKFDRIKVAFLPEFLREGSAIKDFFHGSRIVIGTNHDSIDDLESLFSYSDEIPVMFTDIKTAEFVKYVDNAFHALKVAFANEVYSIGTAYDIDVTRANEIFLKDNILNISPYYLRAGLPFGGSCLPKDMRAIRHLAHQKNVTIPLLDNVLESNRVMQKRIFEKMESFNLRRVFLVGLSFKNHTDDVRESPMLALARDIVDAGYEFRIYDEDLNVVTLSIENEWIVKYLVDTMEEGMKDSEMVIVTKRYMPQVLEAVDPQKHVVLNCQDNKDYDSEVPMHYLYRNTES